MAGVQERGGRYTDQRSAWQLVRHHVHHYQARQAQAAGIEDRDLLAALERAAELQRDLGRLVERLEYRLGRQAYH